MATKNKTLQNYFDHVERGFWQILKAKKPTPIHFVLGISLVVVCFFLGAVLSQVITKAVTKQKPPQKEYMFRPTEEPVTGSMWVDPNTVQVKLGEEFEVTVMADAMNNVVNGVDVVLNYDENFFDVEEITPEMTDLTFPRKKAEDGKIIITAIKTEVDNVPFSEFKIARIKLKAKQKGTSALILEFDGTKASTIIKSGTSENILNNVQNNVIVGVI